MTVRILVGDAREQLRALPDGSVNCVVTSPPYWGLRAYQGDPGMIGLEPTFDEHLANLVAVFRVVWRVLRDDGTVWLNYGDAYASSPPGFKAKGLEKWKTSGLHGGNISERYAETLDQSQGQKRNTVGGGYKPKDLMMMPARVAMALQSDGWWLRSEIIWHKPNPMPESVTDRPTNAHEKVYLLSKRARYFYDAEAVRVPSTGNLSGIKPGRSVVPSSKGADAHDSRSTFIRTRTSEEQAAMGANLRNVWTIATSPFSEAHFATFPPALVEPCIKAGTSERGVCSVCSAPWVRVVDVSKMEIARSDRTHELGRTRSSGTATKPRTSETIGWRPSCECNAAVVPAVVMDPFGGAGTVGLVADRLQRDAILVEISPEYADMAQRRIHDDAPLFAAVV